MTRYKPLLALIAVAAIVILASTPASAHDGVSAENDEGEPMKFTAVILDPPLDEPLPDGELPLAADESQWAMSSGQDYGNGTVPVPPPKRVTPEVD